MSEAPNRKELAAAYKASRPEAGVYRIVNARTGKSLLGSTTNLGSVRNKVAFAQATNSAAVLDQRLAPDIRELGAEAFTLEVLEAFSVPADATPETLRQDLATLHELWRERLSGEPQY